MLKVKSVTLVHALETKGERTTGYRFHHNPGSVEGNGWSLAYDEQRRAVVLTSDRTKETYIVALEQCKYVSVDIVTEEPVQSLTAPLRKPGRPPAHRGESLA